MLYQIDQRSHGLNIDRETKITISRRNTRMHLSQKGKIAVHSFEIPILKPFQKLNDEFFGKFFFRLGLKN